MAKKRKKSVAQFSIVNPHAAGIDIGSRSHWTSTGVDENQTREHGVFTTDLHELCKWLKSRGITTVAMESTGFYWKQLFVMIQSYGMEAVLVNASFTKHIQGRKPSDMSDSQWIWKMHSVGLLPASFQPDFFTEELRTYTRHRQRLIEGASQCANRMQKCLVLMNIQLPVVLSDITGKTGSKIIQAILQGERDSERLAKLADPRVKAGHQTLVKALTGFWQDTHLFELKQHWNHYQFYQQQLKECDKQIDSLLQQQTVTTGQQELYYESQKKSSGKRTLQNLR